MEKWPDKGAVFGFVEHTQAGGVYKLGIGLLHIGSFSVYGSLDDIDHLIEELREQAREARAKALAPGAAEPAE